MDEDIALPADLQGNVAPSADEASPQSPPEEATNTEETETEQPKEIDADIPIAVPTPPLDDDIHMEDTPADDIIVDDVPEEEVARPQAEVPGEVEEVVAPLEEQEEKTEPVPEDNFKQLTDDEASPEDVTEDVTMEPEQEAVPEPPEPEVVEEEPEVEAELHAEHKEATPATEPEQEPEHAEAHDEDGATSADEPLHTTRSMYLDLKLVPCLYDSDEFSRIKPPSTFRKQRGQNSPPTTRRRTVANCGNSTIQRGNTKCRRGSSSLPCC